METLDPEDEMILRMVALAISALSYAHGAGQRSIIARAETFMKWIKEEEE